jgi:predicted phosphate transport protein (TIGR00153 family)
MKFFKKEKEVVELLIKHLDISEDCLTTAIQTIQTYLRDDIKEAKELAKQVDTIENQADLVRYEIRDKLYAGAYLPRLREDIYRLVEAVDEVANDGEHCCDFFLNQRPVIPEELKVMFQAAVQESLGIISPLKHSIVCFLKGECPINVSRQHAKEVGLKESDVDQIEWNLTKDIFTSSLEYSHKIHLKLCLDAIVLVSDRAEDAADQLDLVILKSMV